VKRVSELIGTAIAFLIIGIVRLFGGKSNLDG